MADCNCPAPSAPTNITPITCKTHLGQIQGAWFFRAGVLQFDTTDPASAKQLPATIAGIGNTPDTQTPWDVLLTAADNTQGVFVPLFDGDAAIEAGEPSYYGGNDNSTRNGLRQYVNTAPSTFLASYFDLPSAQSAELDLLICEQLEVVLLDENGNLVMERSTLDADILKPFVCYNVKLLDRQVQGYAAPDINGFTFELPSGWHTKFELTTPAFNALTYNQ